MKQETRETTDIALDPGRVQRVQIEADNFATSKIARVTSTEVCPPTAWQFKNSSSTMTIHGVTTAESSCKQSIAYC